MSNVLKVIDMIAKQSLVVAHEKATFLNTVNRQYDSEFKPMGSGRKIGGSLRIREPNQYTRRQGSRVMDVQDQDESTQTVVLATQDGVDMGFNSAELALDVDNPDQVEAFTERFIEPAMGALISGIESDMLAAFTKDIYNQVGTPGTVVGASGDTAALFNARAKLQQGLAPTGDRSYQIDSLTMASIVNGKTGLFHPDNQVKKAFTEGFYGRAAGADFYENERTYAHANGADHTSITVNDTVATGDSVITLAGATMTVGTVFTIDSVKAVHPETKASYAHDQQFVVTAVNGNDYSVSPTFISTGAKQNISALPQNGATVTASGAASLTYKQNLMYHRDAFVFVTADLPLMDDAHKCVVKRMDNLSVRVWMGSDIRADELLVRLDILYGKKTVRPAWACRITN